MSFLKRVFIPFCKLQISPLLKGKNNPYSIHNEEKVKIGHYDPNFHEQDFNSHM